MERLVRWDNVSNEELRKAENPFFLRPQLFVGTFRAEDIYRT